jgi:signal transduction histidine kinase
MTVWHRRVWLVLWPLGIVVVVLGDLGWWLHGIEPDETYALDVAVGASAITAGLLVWRGQPRNRIGPLLVLAGFLWAIPGIRGFFNPLAAAVGDSLDGAQDVVFAHLLLAYPTGRLGSPWLRALVTAGYGLVALSVFQVTLVDTTTVGTENPLALTNDPALYDRLGAIAGAAGAIYAATGIMIVCSRWLRASPTGRHIYSPVLAAALFFAFAAFLENLMSSVEGTTPRWAILPVVVARIVIPFAFLYGLMRGRLERFGVGDLVVRMSGGDAGDSLRQALARTLHDPALELAYWDPLRRGFVDDAGGVVEVSSENDSRAATLIERDGQVLAAIVHDRALMEDPRLLESVSATAGLLLENQRLQAELRTQLAELRASRERIVRSGDEERRRLERDLHDGAQQRLLGLGMGLQLIRARVEPDSEAAQLIEELETELGQALQELRELARGIHPAVLTEQGLPAAVRALAERAPVPVGVAVPDAPLPASVETAAYFVIAESLSNVAKYARARHAWVTVATENGSARVEVRDDGVGGAQPADGSGLQGLADRVGALGGQLRVESPPGGGTHVTAELPCA